jgi:hypothetical protein
LVAGRKPYRLQRQSLGKNELWLMNVDRSEQPPLPGPEFEAWDPVWVKYAN